MEAPFSLGFEFTNLSMLFGLKVLFVIAGILYFCFAVLVVRQISLMSRTLRTVASPQIKLLGYIHLVVSLVVLIYFFIAL